jgi:hypothetical protein
LLKNEGLGELSEFCQFLIRLLLDAFMECFKPRQIGFIPVPSQKIFLRDQKSGRCRNPGRSCALGFAGSNRSDLILNRFFLFRRFKNMDRVLALRDRLPAIHQECLGLSEASGGYKRVLGAELKPIQKSFGLSHKNYIKTGSVGKIRRDIESRTI